jgi:hypothetical protein
MTVHTRQVCAEHGPALLAVRAATRENPFRLEALAAAGTNSEMLASGIRAGTLAGWLSEAAPTGEVGAWLWTSTDRSLRAYEFYATAADGGEAERGERLYLRKARPDPSLRRTGRGD